MLVGRRQETPGFLADSISNPEDRGDIFLENVFEFNGLHGVVSQVTELLITV
jgi:hypothetical protein